MNGCSIFNRSIFIQGLLVLLFCLGNDAYAGNGNKDIVIIIPSQKQPYQAVAGSIRKEIANTPTIGKVKILDLSAIRKFPQRYLQGNKLVILVGAKALGFYIRSKVSIPFIASFTTKSAFASLTLRTGFEHIFRRNFVGGVALDQPPYRFIRLAKLIKPDLKSIGVVVGPRAKAKSSVIQREASHQGSMLNVANIEGNDNPVTKLRSVFTKSQLLIVFPDKANFNRSLSRWVIALSYKHHVPVISYSKKYADAGALVSLYSEPEQIGKQTAEMARSYLLRGLQPRKLVAPKYFDLRINQSVKQALNLSLPTKSELLKKLYRVAP